MKKVVYDCDNTFGIKNCDVDDGLALLYLLGCGEVELLGITSTYGNSKTDIVYHNTIRMVKELELGHIPIKKGGEKAGEVEHEAGHFLAEMARKYEKELSILATGSLTNLWAAWKIDPQFFDHVKEVVLMGGITEPLVFQKKVMDELNFSCDPEASYTVLTKAKNVATVTGNECLKILFRAEEYREKILKLNTRKAEFIYNSIIGWFDYNMDYYGIDGAYNWDVYPAVYLVHPELFEDQYCEMDLSKEDLKRGYLRISRNGTNVVNLPKFVKSDEIRREIYRAWNKMIV